MKELKKSDIKTWIEPNPINDNVMDIYCQLKLTSLGATTKQQIQRSKIDIVSQMRKELTEQMYLLCKNIKDC